MREVWYSEMQKRKSYHSLPSTESETWDPLGERGTV